MRLFLSTVFFLCLWSTAPGCRAALAADELESRVHWLDSAIDCGAENYPSYANPDNVYAQASGVLKKRRPDGVLFFSVKIIFGHCSPMEKKFIPDGSRNLSVVGLERWPWQRMPFVKEVTASQQTNVELGSYNKLEIRVDEELLLKEITKKEKVSVSVGYHDFNINGIRVKWIFENTPMGLKVLFREMR